MARNYQTFMLSDEPKIAGIPITTGLPVFLLTTIGLITGFATTLFIIGAVLSLTMHLKLNALWHTGGENPYPRNYYEEDVVKILEI